MGPFSHAHKPKGVSLAISPEDYGVFSYYELGMVRQSSSPGIGKLNEILCPVPLITSMLSLQKQK